MYSPASILACALFVLGFAMSQWSMWAMEDNAVSNADTIKVLSMISAIAYSLSFLVLTWVVFLKQKHGRKY